MKPETYPKTLDSLKPLKFVDETFSIIAVDRASFDADQTPDALLKASLAGEDRLAGAPSGYESLGEPCRQSCERLAARFIGAHAKRKFRETGREKANGEKSVFEKSDICWFLVTCIAISSHVIAKISYSRLTAFGNCQDPGYYELTLTFHSPHSTPLRSLMPGPFRKRRDVTFIVTPEHLKPIFFSVRLSSGAAGTTTSKRGQVSPRQRRNGYQHLSARARTI